jgi:hypothetical protein
MDVVPTVVDCRAPVAVIEAKTSRNKFEQAASKRLRDVGDAFFHGDAGAPEQVLHIRRDPNAGIFDELEGLVKDAFDEWLIEQFESRSHVFD